MERAVSPVTPGAAARSMDTPMNRDGRWWSTALACAPDQR